MKGIIVGAAALVLAGCASGPSYEDGGMVYNNISTAHGDGVGAFSSVTGRQVEFYAQCDADSTMYKISFDESRRPEQLGRWDIWMNGIAYKSGTFKYQSGKEYLKALSSLEIRRSSAIGGDRIIKADGERARALVGRCEAAQESKRVARLKANQMESEKQKEENQRFDEISKKTGVEPMPFGSYQIDFNTLVTRIRSSGIRAYLNRFIWVNDGDFRVTQVLGKTVFMQSYSYAHLFMPIQIITDKQVIEGQAWSQVSNRPVQFMGTTNYTTTLGATRQALLFKEI